MSLELQSVDAMTIPLTSKTLSPLRIWTAFPSRKHQKPALLRLHYLLLFFKHDQFPFCDFFPIKDFYLFLSKICVFFNLAALCLMLCANLVPFKQNLVRLVFRHLHFSYFSQQFEILYYCDTGLMLRGLCWTCLCVILKEASVVPLNTKAVWRCHKRCCCF